MVAQFEFLRELCGFALRVLRLKGLLVVRIEKTLTAEYAEKGRRVRKEIQIEPLLNSAPWRIQGRGRGPCLPPIKERWVGQPQRC